MGALFRATHEALGNHIDFGDCLGIVPHALRGSILFAVRAGHTCALPVKHLLVGSGKRNARGRPW